MKGIAVCLKGIEDVMATDIKELTGKKGIIKDTAVIFETEQKNIAKVCYRSQAAVKVLELLGTCKADKSFKATTAAIESQIKKIDLLTLKDHTFRVKCKRIGEHDFHGTDISPQVGEFIIKKTGAKVSLDEPQIIVYVYIYEKACYIGLDYSGFDLSKRDYKIFVHQAGLNATVGYAVFRMSNSVNFIDPMCGSGIIPIEAALYLAGKSPHFFSKDKFLINSKIDLAEFDKDKPKTGRIKAADHLLHYVKATKNNAKLAGIEMEVTRMDIEWLDTKLDKKSWDIVTHPPVVSRQQDPKSIQKLYKEFYYQAEYVVKDSITLIADDDCALKENLENFKIEEEHEIMQGAKLMNILRLKRA